MISRVLTARWNNLDSGSYVGFLIGHVVIDDFEVVNRKQYWDVTHHVFKVRGVQQSLRLANDTDVNVSEINSEDLTRQGSHIEDAEMLWSSDLVREMGKIHNGSGSTQRWQRFDCVLADRFPSRPGCTLDPTSGPCTGGSRFSSSESVIRTRMSRTSCRTQSSSFELAPQQTPSVRDPKLQ